MKLYRKLIVIFFGLGVFFYWQNNDLTISHYTYQNPKIPSAFKDFKIVQLSDLHNKSFGNDQARLLKQVQKQKPDIVLITGDIVDSRRTDFSPAMKLVSELSENYPVYYVPGNHEGRLANYDILEKQLIDNQVTILDNKSIKLHKEGQTIKLTGVLDPSFYSWQEVDDATIMNFLLENYSDPSDQFEILLSHRPELINVYAENNIDLTFSGHAHGGQVRLPLIGPIIAPNQGLFPEYTSGQYKQEASTLVVSRGLGNSLFPLRIFDRPDIVSVVLK